MSVDYAYKRLGAELSNWGRWGEDDQLGTLNLITDDVVRRAVRSVRSGRRFELSIPLGTDGPLVKPGRIARANPLHVMTAVPGDLAIPDGVIIADDYVIMPLQAGTQWDGLSHVGYDGLFYNGVPGSAVKAVGGASRNSVAATLPGAVTRGVLLDAARHRGVEILPADAEIDVDELEAIERAQGVEVREGDVVLLRTGWRLKALRDGWEGWLEREPGLALYTARWLKERGVAAIASDNWGLEIQPAPEAFIPLHCVLIRDLGMMIGEILDLEALAEDCAVDGQWDFLFSAPALRIAGAVGSPISPVAVK